MESSTRRQVLKAGFAGSVALPFMAAHDGALAAPALDEATPAAHQPKMRDMTVTMVPLLVHEMAATLPFLADDFAKGGMLESKEVFAFMPHTLVAYAGDSISLHIYNPANDPHTFSVTELHQSVDAPAKSVAAMVLERLPAGIYTFDCAVAEHLPFMWGQIVVLPAPA